jgi:hypothetical protein
MKYPRIATGALVFGTLLMASYAVQAQPKRAERVSMTSCPYPGVTANCLMVRAQDGTVYNISSASPRPRLTGRMIRIRGTVTDKASACGQGIVLDRVRWTRTRQRCPN